MEDRRYGKVFRNFELYMEYYEDGFEYILNPDTQELHSVDPQNFLGSHNLESADLENFTGLINVGFPPLHDLEDGIEVPIYDYQTCDLIDTYRINKCKHCFPSAG